VSVLLFVGVLAQGLDAVTMDLSREANELIVELGPTAYLAKIALILGVTALAWSLPRLRSSSRLSRLRRPMAMLLASLLLAVGEVGAISNLLASG
jgi:hypothetical protein